MRNILSRFIGARRRHSFIPGSFDMEKRSQPQYPYIYYHLKCCRKARVSKIAITVMEDLRNEGLFHGKGAAEHFRVNPKTIYRQLWAKVMPANKVG